ncbi:MAG: hypothetical protein KDB37_04520 [Ilumatobacter sp.]|nr:hypothetical protein [Ilumatobacter sp.]
MVAVRAFSDDLPSPIDTLERHLRDGGVSLVQAVFENTFFASPDAVRARSPYFPGHARRSREHYPGLDIGAAAEWEGQPVKLGSNGRAQMAWEKYSGWPIQRGSGYGVRHIWGHPWDPIAFTAGWNLAYMPFWAGMLTEDQHPHPLVQLAIKQAGWELYFRTDPVCAPPAFVDDPGLDLDEVLGDQPLLIATSPPKSTAARGRAPVELNGLGPADAVIAIRRQLGNSWSNLRKAVQALQGVDHEPFGTPNVEATSKSHVRRIMRETGLGLTELSAVIEKLAPPAR